MLIGWEIGIMASVEMGREGTVMAKQRLNYYCDGNNFFAPGDRLERPELDRRKVEKA